MMAKLERRLRKLFRAVTLGLLLGATATGAPEAPDSNRRMAQRLARIREAIPPQENPYANRQRAKLLAQSDWDGLPAGEELDRRIQLAVELLRSGQTTAALAETQRVAALARRHRPTDQPLEWFLQQLKAIGHLRLAEQENCIAHHNTDSCLLPLPAGGVHQNKTPSRKAIEALTACLRLRPGDLGARWLINLAHMTLGEYPESVPRKLLIPPQVFASGAKLPRFRDVAPEAGLAVLGLSGGVAADDFTGDGHLDVICSSWGTADPLRFFVSDGRGAFQEATQRAGLEGITGGLNLCHADFDNDGFRDVLVLRGAWLETSKQYPNSLLRNHRGEYFEDVTEQAGLLTFHGTQTAAWGDYNNDGWVDLFVGNESTPRSGSHRCELFHNNGDGTFTECAARVGVAALGFVKGVAWGDYNNDSRVDLYVSRLGEPNLLFRNEGSRTAPTPLPRNAPTLRPPAKTVQDWKFTEVAQDVGVIEPLESFPVWFWDYDNDGNLDLFVGAYGWRNAAADVAADYLGAPHHGSTPRLYRNGGDGTFSDETDNARLDKVLIVMGANFGDLDNDGYLDFYVGTGEPDLGALVPNRMFKNAAGRHFEDVTTAGGFGHLQKGHGVAFADFDGDGDQDVYTVLGGAYEGDAYPNALFLNPGTPHHWLTVRLEGVQSSRDAFGARLQVVTQTQAGPVNIHRVVGAGGSFGQNSLQAEIGLGAATGITAFTIRWPSGLEQRFADLPMDRVVRIREGEAEVTLVEARPWPTPARQ
jgi:hypothetical protein